MVTPEQLVDVLNDVFGKQPPDGRAAHAKGVVLTGTFKPADAASSVTVAPHLQKASVIRTSYAAEWEKDPSKIKPFPQQGMISRQNGVMKSTPAKPDRPIPIALSCRRDKAPD